MLERVLEPEVMDTAAEAADYDAMDHTEVNRRFVDDLLAVWPAEEAGASVAARPRVLDVGTGTALIPIELCRRQTACRVVAMDLAEEMLKLARKNVAAAGLADRIELRLADAKRLSDAPGTFDAVVSNSIVHHIPEPATALAEMWRLVRPGGVLFVRDLLRPASVADVERCVGLYTAGASPHQQQLFRQSLHAALSLDETADLLAALGLPRSAVRQTTDRHWTISVAKPAVCHIRRERPGDEPAIRSVLLESFPTPAEAQLVEQLRAAGRLTLSLVAEVDGQIVGQFACSPVTTRTGATGAGLAPLSVRPSFRRRGIAAELMRAWLDRSADAKVGWAVVLGEPHYYARFGFRPAAEFGLADEYSGGPAFQALELIPGALPRGAGLVRYAPEFAVFA